MIFSLLGIVSRQRQNESKSFLEKYPLGVNSELELLLKKKNTHTHTKKTHSQGLRVRIHGGKTEVACKREAQDEITRSP